MLRIISYSPNSGKINEKISFAKVLASKILMSAPVCDVEKVKFQRIQNLKFGDLLSDFEKNRVQLYAQNLLILTK